MTVRMFCLIVALILFAVAALGVGAGRVNLVAAGLAFVAAGEFVG